MGHRAAIYCRVSTADQSCERQEFDLRAFAGRAGYDVVGIFRMLATFLSGIAEFERDLISERVKSGLAVAKARGKRLGRQAGVRPKSDRLLPKVVAMRAEGRSYRWIARELGISKNTVADIVQRHRANA
ncbi:recombinase family protein [Enterobacter hormaechei]|uniref:recombinase family protein n=1 Tax=Enterobacter hormaechei TaxID=158836 RepID=UPI001AAFFE2A|nr:recombinase family protein [Enterobacter hormaechei]MBO2808915.1 recombinase family protein [Enterobacter hormaechei]